MLISKPWHLTFLSFNHMNGVMTQGSHDCQLNASCIVREWKSRILKTLHNKISLIQNWLNQNTIHFKASEIFQLWAQDFKFSRTQQISNCTVSFNLKLYYGPYITRSWIIWNTVLLPTVWNPMIRGTQDNPAQKLAIISEWASVKTKRRLAAGSTKPWINL